MRTATTMFHALPTELWLHLCSFLDVRDFVNLCSTSRDLRTAGQEEWVWRTFLLRDCPSIVYHTLCFELPYLFALIRSIVRCRRRSTTYSVSTMSRISSVDRGSGFTAARWYPQLFFFFFFHCFFECPWLVSSRCRIGSRSTSTKTEGT